LAVLYAWQNVREAMHTAPMGATTRAID